MLTDLRAEEVTLKEEGQTRRIKRVERDGRPLALAVLVDSSEVMGKPGSSAPASLRHPMHSVASRATWVVIRRNAPHP